jgi:hypothetical protein
MNMVHVLSVLKVRKCGKENEKKDSTYTTSIVSQSKGRSSTKELNILMGHPSLLKECLRHLNSKEIHTHV